LAGGASGDQIRAELARAGVASQFTRIGAESRRTIQITDHALGQVTSLEEPPPYITTEELGRLATDYRALLDGAEAVVLCGSLPAGLPAETYGSLTRYAAEAGVPVILNAGGSALRHGAVRGPALIIPEDDLEADEFQVSDAAPAGVVVIRSGPAVHVSTAAGDWTAIVEPVASTGLAADHAEGELATAQRDALVAGLVPGIALGWSWPDMLRHAVALAASVSPDGDADLAAYEKLLPDVCITGPRD
jgi:tagatose 6-phosphate kinase